MVHVSPGMIEQQLVLVLNACKTVSGGIKSENTFHLRETWTTVNSLKI